MKVDLRVVELLSSRLCHDLISPVGAVGNGLELLEEDDAAMAADALQLCLKSNRRAAALLQFFRSAFGTAGSQASFRLADARSVAAALLEGTKVTLDWPAGLGDAAAPEGAGKLLLNLLLLAVEALPRGGQIVVDLAPAAGRFGATATANGQDARLSDELRAALAVEASVEGLTAKTVPGYFAARLAESFGGRVEVASPAPGSVRFAVSLAAL